MKRSPFGKLKISANQFMQTIRWIRVILSAVFILLGLAFGTYFYIKEHSPAIASFDGCAVVFAPDGSSENIPFGDPRCPK